MLLRSRIGLFFAAFFIVIGIQLPFWPVWLASRGLDAREIGLVLSAALWGRVIAAPLAGMAADRTGNRKAVLAVLGLMALATTALFLVAGGFSAILVIALLSSAFFSPMMSLGDNLALLIAYARKFDYGRLRLWGSLSFIAAASLGGVLLARHGPDAILYLILGGVGLTALAALALPRPPAGNAQPQRGGMIALLCDPDFLLFLAAAALIQSSHSVYYAFGTLYWRKLGHGEDVIGWLWAEGVVVEILLFAVSNRIIDRIAPMPLLMVAGLAGLVRWTGTAMAETLPVLVVLQALHGLTFGAGHLAAMHYLARSVPVERSATAQALYGALGSGLGFALAMMLAGFLYQHIGAGAYFGMAVMGAAGAGLAWILSRRADGTAIPAP
jgi:PPP family 3-phenylpropionic acid transporter